MADLLIPTNYMILDLIMAFVAVWSLMKGYRMGLIRAALSLFSVFTAILIALKSAATVSQWLMQSGYTAGSWTPLLSFLMVLIAVLLLFHWAGRMLEDTATWLTLGWLNRIGGMVFYLLWAGLLLSSLLYFTEKMSLLPPEQLNQSRLYPLLRPLLPDIMNLLGGLIPFFSRITEDLDAYFDLL